MTATQADVDTLTQKVNDVQAQLDTDRQALQTEVDSLQQQINAGTPPADLDLTGLQTAVDKIGTTATDLGSITPTAPATQEQAPTHADGTAKQNTTDAEEAARDNV